MDRDRPLGYNRAGVVIAIDQMERRTRAPRSARTDWLLVHRHRITRHRQQRSSDAPLLLPRTGSTDLVVCVASRLQDGVRPLDARSDSSRVAPSHIEGPDLAGDGRWFRVPNSVVCPELEVPSLSTSGETLIIEESVNLEGENGDCWDVGDGHEWSRGCG